MDSTLCLLQNADIRPTVRFGVADSSPQKGNDWLLSSCDEMLAVDVAPCFQAFQQLVGISDRRLAGLPIDEKRSRMCHATVFQSISRVTNIPVALGQGATTLSHKVSALLHVWTLGRPPERLKEEVATYRASFVSFCADMGVELGVAQYAVDCVRTF